MTELVIACTSLLISCCCWVYIIRTWRHIAKLRDDATTAGGES